MNKQNPAESITYVLTPSRWGWIFIGIWLLVAVLCACQPIRTLNTTPQTSAASTLASQLQTTTGQASTTTSTATYTPIPPTPMASATATPAPTTTPVPPVVFAAIGDYGSGDSAEAEVADQILSWNPDFIMTLGDNNYPDGAADHIDQAIGQFFHSYIYPYKGSYGAGAEENRFFPSLGNHDVQTEDGKPYFDYFTLPGNERYYDFTWGPVHLFAIDNIETEPDGVGASSIQAEWLKAGLAASNSAWNIVYMHYPPYSSGLHGSIDWAQWPYKEWGADAVLSGHDHTYERLEENGLPYFVNGLGGFGIYYFLNILEGSQVRYNLDYGAMRIEATDGYLSFKFISQAGDVIILYQLRVEGKAVFGTAR